MGSEALAWGTTPALTDVNDGTDCYNMGVSFTVGTATGRPCYGVRWRVPDTVATPFGGVHAAAIWSDTAGTREAYKEFTPVPGGDQDILFDAPLTLDTTSTWIAAIYTNHYVFRGVSPSGITSPTGNISAVAGRLVQTNVGAASAGIPSGTFSATYYISPILDDGLTGDAIAPSGIAVPVALGSPVLADSALAAAPSGIAVPAALGSPTLAGPGLAAVPSGIAVPAALGAPILAGPGLAIAPSGIAIAATAGAPASVAMTVPGTTCAPSGIAVPVALGAPSLRMIDRGSWDGLLNAINSARADHEIDQERLRNPIDCPIHHWPLQPTARGLHCLFGGHVVTPG